ncbi:MAG: EAL domain-containing protein [Hyphomicrobiales bacterium]|nr:EAL domain-containing protein [Hyphomicrobiales bacterium]
MISTAESAAPPSAGDAGRWRPLSIRGLCRFARSLWQTATYLGLALIVCIWIGVVLLSEEARRRAIDNGVREGGNLTRIFEQYISNLIRGADSALLVLRDAYERQPETFDIRRWIDRAKLQNELVIQFGVAGADGIVRHSSMSATPSLDINDREYFRALAETSADELSISKPLVGRISGRSTIQLVRRIRARDGTFGGVIYASLDIRQLEKFYNSINVGPEGIVSLTGLDGVVRARSGPRSAATELIGRSVPYARFLNVHREVPVGSYWSVKDPRHQLDDIRRLISYRVLDGLPLVAVVGLAERDILAPAEASAANYRTIGAALTVFVLVMIVLGGVRKMRIIAATEALHQSKASLTRTNALFDTALNNISQGLCMFDGSARLSVCNRRYLEMYLLSPEIVKPGCTLRELMEHRRAVGLLSEDPELYAQEILDRVVRNDTRVRLITARDGRIVRAINHPIPGGGWVSTHEDITDRHLAELGLAEANRQLTAQQWAIDQAVMVSTSDARGRIVYVNDSLCRTSGFSRERLLGQTHSLFRSGVHRDEFYADMYRRISRGEVWRAEMCNKAADGSLYWTDTTIVPRLGPDGKPDAFMAIRVDVTARKQAESQIEFLARHDPLTGLVNRAVFLEEIERSLAGLRTGGPRFAVMLIDLDHFKDVNDMLGHASGDSLLEIVARRLRERARHSDVVARLGGDEFALLTTDSDDAREHALILANSLLTTITATYDLGGQEAVIGASIGIAVAEDGDSEAGQLLKRADIALYKVKSEGRDGVCFFDGALEREAHSRAQLVIDLWKAMQRGEFELYYQPIVDLTTGAVCCMEALVRWRHPVRGLVLPGEFIAMAEESGAITVLGDWILRNACADAACWPPHVKVSVNLSPAQFRKGGLVEAVTGALTDSRLSAERLELEITESVLIQKSEANFALLYQLRSLGVSIVLDDFGTGYASLSYLRLFPFDKIKIDRSFVNEMSSNADSAAIVCAVAGLARNLEMDTTAEGVETVEQLELLRVAGCRQAQGYLFARPRPAVELDFGDRLLAAEPSEEAA